MTSDGTLLFWRIMLWAAPLIGGIIALIANYKINSIETQQKKEKEKMEASKAIEREKKMDSIISENAIKESVKDKSTEKTGANKSEINEKRNTKDEKNSLETDTKAPQTVNVTSINQQGGITANEVKIYNKEPDPPVESEIIKILNTVNPSILERYKNGESQICVMISESNLLQLSKIKSEAKTLEHFDFISWFESKIENRSFAEIVREKSIK